MSEELKKTDIKKIAGRGCLIVAGILFLIFLCRYNQIKKESLYDTEGRTFAKATVMNVLQDNETKDGIYIGRQLVKLKITSGKIFSNCSNNIRDVIKPCGHITTAFKFLVSLFEE